MNEKSIRQYMETVRTKLPGNILGFDLADTKRRNLYLGMNVMDKDIQDFDELLKQYFTVDGVVIRISGDKWLCFFTNHPQESVNRLKDDYSTTTEIKVTWGCKAISRNHERKEIIKETHSKITRAYRCLMD